MNKKQKLMLIRIIISLLMMVALFFIPSSGALRLVLYIIPYLIVGYDILIKAFKGIIRGQVLDECFLMATATVGAFALAIYENSGDYTEAIAVMLFYQIGELFQSYAVGKSRKNITELMDIRPDYANIEKDGKLEKVDPDDVGIGSTIIVQPGEKVPIDGIVIEGNSTLNTAALTGESLPREVQSGDEIISGSINITGLLKIKTTKEFGESTVSKILDLVENATVGLDAAWESWIYRALTFLVISCPCALVISIPLSFFAGLGGSSNAGILVKGSNYMETLSKTKIVVFDKTGTLTQGVFEVNGIHHNTIENEKIIEYAALAESSSSHPIAKSLQKEYGREIDRTRVSDVQEISGKGIIATVDGHTVACGNEGLMEYLSIRSIPCHSIGTIVHVAIDGAYTGHIVISDVVKPNAAEAIRKLRAAGIRKTVMLTGDRKTTAEKIAKELGIEEVYSELLPSDKVEKVENILKAKSNDEKLAFVGDGINDAPVLGRADIGIAMGAMGSDAAIEAADVVLMDDDPLKIAKAIRISQKCMRIVYENIVFAIGVKALCLILGAVGIANMWLAIFADVGVMVLAVLNAIRALFVKKL